MSGGVELAENTDAMVLIHSFLTLLKRLQLLATVPAIDSGAVWSGARR
jgi:hypothetical protein